MTDMVNDLAERMTRPPAGTGLGIASATVLTWDAATFRGTYDYEGTVLADLPVLSGAEALTYRPGDEVMLQTWHPVDGHSRKGFGSYFVLGRVVRPGAANAGRAIAFMTQTLAQALTLEIVGAAFHLDDSGGGVITTTGGFADADGGAGPTVAGVEVQSGRALIIIGMLAANLNFGAPDSTDGVGFLDMSVQVSGATSIAPGRANGVPQARLGSSSSAVNFATDATPMAALVVPLTNGTHTITAKYQITNDLVSASALDPMLIVVPF